jgi:predicted dehydrogenase
MVQLALIGIGGYGRALARAIRCQQEAGRCRLVAAADTRLDELSEPADELGSEGVSLYRDAGEMLQAIAGRCQGVYIAAGIASHAPLTVAAARAGLHVHLEKPAAATVQEVAEMRGALDQADRFCLVGYQEPQGLDAARVVEIIASGQIGTTRRLTCSAGWPRAGSYYARNAWAGRLRSGDRWVLDGPATNALNHQLYNMLLLSGAAAGLDGLAEPLAVRAELYATGEVESHNSAFVRVETACDVPAWLMLSHATDSQYGPVIRVEGSAGSVHWSPRRGAHVHRRDGRREEIPDDTDRDGRMVDNFVRAIETDDAGVLRCPLGEAGKAIALLDGAHESSGTIHRVDGRYVREVEASSPSRRWVVEGLDERLEAFHDDPHLPGESKDAPPWAVAGETFELTDYTSFPRRFHAPT